MTSEHHAFDIESLATACRDCALGDLCLPHGMSADDIELLEKQVETVGPLARGVPIVEPGQAYEQLYAVKSGVLKSYRYTADGDEQVLGFHFPGELFGLDAIYPEEHRFYVSPLVESSVCAIGATRLNAVADAVPAFRRQLTRLMSMELNSRSTFARDMQADQAIAAFLLDLSSRFKERALDANNIMLPMTRRDIANYLRLRTETVSRVFRKFQDCGWLSVDKQLVTLNNRQALAALTA